MIKSFPQFLSDVSDMCASCHIGQIALLRLMSLRGEGSVVCDIQATEDDDGESF